MHSLLSTDRIKKHNSTATGLWPGAAFPYNLFLYLLPLPALSSLHPTVRMAGPRNLMAIMRRSICRVNYPALKDGACDYVDVVSHLAG